MAQNDVIVYNFVHLQNLSTRMSWIVSALENVKELTAKSCQSAEEYWQGNAYEAFVNRATEMNKSLDKLYEQVSASKEKLDKAIALEKENEADILQNTVGGLSADDIFNI